MVPPQPCLPWQAPRRRRRCDFSGFPKELVVIATSRNSWMEGVSQPTSLAEPRITGCCFAELFFPRLAALNLDWHETLHGQSEQTWILPRGLRIAGQAPILFGIRICRTATDGYLVRMVWNEMQFSWADLTRQEILESSLSVVLAALGTSLEYLLDQPASPAE
jgi:hypothetical protein